jgi:ABC-type dipeptide/oligopeptide/nickel transport systems, permease components
LVIAAANGISLFSVILGALIAQVPSVARVAYSASTDVALSGFVESAKIRGESTLWIVSRELIPNISRALAADVGVRVTLSILLITAANFLGVGAQPPGADWGLMLSENRYGFENNPFAMLVPALVIAFLTIGVSFLADSLSQVQQRNGAVGEQSEDDDA